MTTLSRRGQFSSNFSNLVREYERSYMSNKFHKQHNPEGILNMGIAENSLCEDILLEKLNQPEMNVYSTEDLHYFDVRGSIAFRTAIAEFMTERFHSPSPISPDNIYVTAGVGAATDILMHAFTDPGDCMLIPAPYYYSTKTDVGMRGQMECYPIDVSTKTETRDAFTFTVEDIKLGLANARKEGKRVKGIILINPNNPTGHICPLNIIKDVLQFANTEDLHVVVDEVYALSVFIEGASFESVLQLPDLPCPEKTHAMWGFSKDFALSGFRCGIIHTLNKEFFPSVASLIDMGSVPHLVQEKLRHIIQDKSWLDNVYFPTNRSRMVEGHELVKKKLESLGICVHPVAKAGYFIWANLGKYMDAMTLDAEMSLFRDLFAAGLFLIPGSELFCQDPGWFRVTFTHPQDFLCVGLTRLEKVLQSRC